MAQRPQFAPRCPRCFGGLDLVTPEHAADDHPSELWALSRSRQSLDLDRSVRADIRHVAEVAYPGHPSAGQFELDEVTGLRVAAVPEHGQHLAAIQPGGHQVPVIDRAVLREVSADFPPPRALRTRHQIESDL